MDIAGQNAAVSRGSDLAVKSAERTAALAEARVSSNEVRAQENAAARARSAEKLAETREAIARAIGANTRLSIEKATDTSSFVYRAIDVNTGEIVHEWPEAQFLSLIRNVRTDVQVDIEAKGLILDDFA